MSMHMNRKKQGTRGCIHTNQTDKILVYNNAVKHVKLCRQAIITWLNAAIKAFSSNLTAIFLSSFKPSWPENGRWLFNVSILCMQAIV